MIIHLNLSTYLWVLIDLAVLFIGLGFDMGTLLAGGTLYWYSLAIQMLLVAVVTLPLLLFAKRGHAVAA